MRTEWHIIRDFSTAQFRVTLAWAWDDYVDIWDDTGETREKLQSGEWGAFLFRVQVQLDGDVIGEDVLGGSIYARPEEFGREHFGLAPKCRADGRNYGCYYSDMMKEAIKEARARVVKLQAIKLRAPLDA